MECIRTDPLCGFANNVDPRMVHDPKLVVHLESLPYDHTKFAYTLSIDIQEKNSLKSEMKKS